LDYSGLAVDMLEQMRYLHGVGPQKSIDDVLQGETFVLLCIAHHGGETLPGAISAEMNVSSARIAQALNSTEKKGWITRKIDPCDRRRILVALTPAGNGVVEERMQMMHDLARKMLERLGKDDAKEYVRILGRLVDIFRNEPPCYN